MADGVSSALPAPQTPMVMPPAQPVQRIVPAAQPFPEQPIQPANISQLNLLHFKPELQVSQIKMHNHIFLG